MSRFEQGVLFPESVSQWINFKGRKDPDWRYLADDCESMAARQTEGVAYLWNLLTANKVALLADEVGMGKTFQALGVAAWLWKNKPDARVLVMAPNRHLCGHWRREFEGFVREHIRQADGRVKGTDGMPVPKVCERYKLEDLVQAVENDEGQLYLTTVYALSGLLGAEQRAEGAGGAGRIAGDFHQLLKQHLGPSGFDLIIVDEAHYLRNKFGKSQRVAAAMALFGEADSRLGAWNLLLTATPSHTRLDDVRNILSYFTPIDADTALEPLSAAERTGQLLRRYALRRLRLMEGQGGLYGKRHYRHEKALPASFDGRPDAEMFFALYQKRLVADLGRQKENKSLTYGYLEGFESFGWQPQTGVGADADYQDAFEDRVVEDFARASDTELLRELTRTYHKQFHTFPDHPKYDLMTEQCVPKSGDGLRTALEDLKHLIFVRRIPSVRELTQRINERYDQLLAGMIVNAWGKHADDPAVEQWRHQGWSRDGYAQFLEGVKHSSGEMDAHEEAGQDDGEEEGAQLASRIAELFVVKKGAGGQTDCANVRLRFSKPESIFALFLEPASDYLTGGYTAFYAKAETGRVDYVNAARYVRLHGWGMPEVQDAAARMRGVPHDHLERSLHSVWSLLVPRLPQALYRKLEGWARGNKAIAENFANYIKAGFLYASPVVVELYAWFVEYRQQPHERDVQRAYRGFHQWVGTRIDDSLMLRYFIAALETFDTLCGKIIDHGLEQWDEEWRSLKRLTSPCWYASGENSEGRSRLILGFNSPFYPNVLVSTSVFQEGVNLHLQCHQVHHYGLAGSPGDNEQRVGRLDRLFGCVNQRLQRSGDAQLSIHYPFLQASVDEDQVASFIERKHQVEEQMDACVQVQFDKQLRIGDAQQWRSFLRRPIPISAEPLPSPYGARFPGRDQPCDGRSRS
ncbi:DEAD/DEAH box helicase [Pseudomonas japonica]|uniref:Helicase conserved C-terminal domain-containing protein n=1 Tax=Pseudomonas japonica TaxID=256466 RepID=A0A239KVA8_9PSED|nr:DEAD/DEAH box helicase [Pseudomonas japonica]SNT21598.1 Helicase conserved C-terminal domain-containing protein [Pseudomonas japonica]